MLSSNSAFRIESDNSTAPHLDWLIREARNAAPYAPPPIEEQQVALEKQCGIKVDAVLAISSVLQALPTCLACGSHSEPGLSYVGGTKRQFRRSSPHSNRLRNP